MNSSSNSKQLQELELLCGYTTTTLAPIGLVPDETLTVILRQASPRLKTLENGRKAAKVYCTQCLETVPIVERLRRWCRLLKDIPSVWSEIIIATWLPKSLTIRFIERSNARLLDVYLLGWIKVSDNQENDNYSIATILHNTAHRIRILSIEDPEGFSVLNHLGAKGVYSMPILQVLRAFSISAYKYRATLEASNLRLLDIGSNDRFFHKYLHRDCFQNLQELKAEFSLIERFKAAGKVANNLISLNIMMSGNIWMVFRGDNSPAS
ncbi:hypothetical protein M422DRAFT_44685 [Sphaerobolus stellatus SS14]|nr:hypothetical protein M422DRAFT_44685 [Sphaerobolus stellatus SS14]